MNTQVRTKDEIGVLGIADNLGLLGFCNDVPIDQLLH